MTSAAPFTPPFENSCGTPFAPVPVTMSGGVIRLEPLGLEHAEGLLAAGHYESLWRVTVQPPLTTPQAVTVYLRQAAESLAAGLEVPFAIMLRATGELVGATRWMDISRPHRRCEIGATWVTPAHQRSAVNTEAKLLQMTHLFDVLGAHRVQYKTDVRNVPSQRALDGIGAVREGVLRRHMVVRDGFVRDSVYYGITDEDWLRVRRILEDRLTSRGA